MTHLSIVIPVLNETSLIDELVKRVKIASEQITNDFEIILVDDGSTDNTWNQILKNTNLENRVKAIRFTRNFGHHYAITAGLQKASGEWVVVMDGDLQDRPEVIPQLYKMSSEGYDVVFVSRKNRTEKIYYRISQKIFYFILNLLSGVNFDSSQANFSIINRKVVEAFKAFPENSRFYGSTINWLGFKRGKILADQGKRFSGEPSYTIRKRLKLALDIIFSFSDRPLKWAIGLGFFLSLVASILGIYIVFRALTSGFSVMGWPSLIAAIFFNTGVILIVLGILGVYIGRVYTETKGRPLYAISEKINI
jgi:glycosyltransferase involved in cell wall biosynthesis